MSAIIQDEPLVIPAGIVDLKTFRAWSLSEDFPEYGKIDYIAGKIEVDMSPANVWKHSGLKTMLSSTLLQMITDRKLGYVFVDQTRVVSPIADLSREPDIVFLSWESLKSGRVVMRPSAHPKDDLDMMEIEGGPDLIVEVVSPSSVTKDTKRLPPIYFAAGVQEYWIADARGTDPKLSILKRGKKAFEPAAERASFQASPVLGLSFKLESAPGPVPHSILYTLKSK